MTTIVGGLRARLVRESVFEMLRDALTALDWFDVTRPHSPVTLHSKNLNQNEVIPINSAALSDEIMNDDDIELGSMLSEHRWTMYVDFFGESDAVGLHFIRDVHDILQGRMSAIGRSMPNVTVYDYRQATPPVIATVQIENVLTDKAHGFLKPWLEHWYACRFEIVDEYDSDNS